MFIDTHCHLTINDIEAIEKMNKNIIITSGADKESNEESLKLSQMYDNVFCTLGIHPEGIDENIEENIKFIEENIKNIVAIGEIGLDYYYSKDNKNKQKEIFIKQLDLALKYNLPVVIHSRDADEDTYNILKEYPTLKKDIHCYSYSLESALKYIKINSKIGIGGVVTFKNAKNIINVVKNIPLEYILLETDSPWLSPEPFRGKSNEPYNCFYVASKIAEIKNISQEKVFEITTKNAVSQFDLNV